ncbi:hypothetical protein ITX31_13945 [Arthrobacter gandavensis]|uniref:hypothetical protein n=1 Tax=Arthrobacter gandavensis TaxID=169960 RepID=UPI00188F2DE4|nr:hypothetical protein [Arthrobacter gandavensis]MBF4995205.1 hypothetical protein [Arthrobacter gandavensis]
MTGRSRRESGARRLIGIAAALALLPGLQACSVPGFPGSSEGPESSAASMVPGPAVDNDLADGSTSHRLGAASHTLVLDYWTSEDPAGWTPESSPIINVSVKIDGAPGPGAVRVTRFNARVDAMGVELTNDQGSFALEPPYAYTSGFSLPANPSATSTTVLFTIDLLTETEPGSGVFTRQTVLDTLTVGYPGGEPDAGAAPKG